MDKAKQFLRRYFNFKQLPKPQASDAAHCCYRCGGLMEQGMLVQFLRQRDGAEKAVAFCDSCEGTVANWLASVRAVTGLNHNATA
jgi:hypothetical protein